MEDMTAHVPFQNYAKFHLVGIKGVAMTSMTQSLLDLGKNVTGSDVKEDFVTHRLLERLDVKISHGFTPENLEQDVDCVIYSGAHKGAQNPIVREARRRGIPVFHHAAALAQLTQGKQTVAVCGVGGKTTTSAMLAWILAKAGMDPSYSVGVGDILGLGRTGKYVQNSTVYVAEADEYLADPLEDRTPRFLFLSPKIVICTNIVWDHPDAYANLEETLHTYLELFRKLPHSGMLIGNGDDPNFFSAVRNLSYDGAVMMVGNGKDNALNILDYRIENRTAIVRISIRDREETFTLHIPGLHNAKNACYALLAAERLGVARTAAIEALSTFRGTMRRFEHKGVWNGVVFIDDYAHHPSEIKATIAAARAWFPNRRIIVLFQPHTYSRTKALLHEFAQALARADVTLLLDIFASARESADPAVSSELLVELIEKYGAVAKNVRTLEVVDQDMRKRLQPGDVVLTLGAGDLYRIHEAFPLQSVNA